MSAVIGHRWTVAHRGWELLEWYASLDISLDIPFSYAWNRKLLRTVIVSLFWLANQCQPSPVPVTIILPQEATDIGLK